MKVKWQRKENKSNSNAFARAVHQAKGKDPAHS